MSYKNVVLISADLGLFKAPGTLITLIRQWWQLLPSVGGLV